MALLSRFPIEEATNHRLPDGQEPRTALAARGSASAMTAWKWCSSVFIYIGAPRSAWPKRRNPLDP